MPTYKKPYTGAPEAAQKQPWGNFFKHLPTFAAAVFMAFGATNADAKNAYQNMPNHLEKNTNIYYSNQASTSENPKILNFDDYRKGNNQWEQPSNLEGWNKGAVSYEKFQEWKKEWVEFACSKIGMRASLNLNSRTNITEDDAEFLFKISRTIGRWMKISLDGLRHIDKSIALYLWDKDITTLSLKSLKLSPDLASYFNNNNLYIWSIDEKTAEILARWWVKYLRLWMKHINARIIQELSRWGVESIFIDEVEEIDDDIAENLWSFFIVSLQWVKKITNSQAEKLSNVKHAVVFSEWVLTPEQKWIFWVGCYITDKKLGFTFDSFIIIPGKSDISWFKL